ncbi:MAG TPA: hypothetical protein VFH08_02285 [Chitinophagaceae bacterium]|nr:hypothetical protein [Chitinophagaceae bacterium]
MERQFNNGDFEKLLRDNANQYRMYPSEKVWKGIDSALHSRRRWYGLTAAILFLITGSVVSIFIFNDTSEKNTVADQKIASPQNSVSKVTPALPGKHQKFTPEIKRTKPADQRAVYITESYFNSPLLSTHAGDEQSVANLNNPNNIRYEESFDGNIPGKNEISSDEQLLINLGILKNNSKVETAIAQYAESSLEERMITDQSRVDENTGKKITDEISALASQNVSITKSKKQSRVTAQIYFTPTVSYRKLSENKNVYNNSSFYVPSIDVNHLVKHKPGMGLEFGLEGRYHLNKKLSLKTGLQFNLNRYDIKAYSHPTEIATVALSSGYGVDSLASLSNYRNFSSTATPNWLENFYFQVAVPVGAEIILSDRKNIQWGISGTIQPTYVIGDRAYLISSDYKNYAKFPDVMRRWNLSTGIGTFVSYSTGRIKWQAGPHLRYQHLSSFVSELTVKENLFAIGLKVGATLDNKK